MSFSFNQYAKGCGTTAFFLKFSAILLLVSYNRCVLPTIVSVCNLTFALSQKMKGCRMHVHHLFSNSTYVKIRLHMIGIYITHAGTKKYNICLKNRNEKTLELKSCISLLFKDFKYKSSTICTFHCLLQRSCSYNCLNFPAVA